MGNPGGRPYRRKMGFGSGESGHGRFASGVGARPRAGDGIRPGPRGKARGGIRRGPGGARRSGCDLRGDPPRPPSRRCLGLPASGDTGPLREGLRPRFDPSRANGRHRSIAGGLLDGSSVDPLPALLPRGPRSGRLGQAWSDFVHLDRFRIQGRLRSDTAFVGSVHGRRRLAGHRVVSALFRPGIPGAVRTVRGLVDRGTQRGRPRDPGGRSARWRGAIGFGGQLRSRNRVRILAEGPNGELAVFKDVPHPHRFRRDRPDGERRNPSGVGAGTRLPVRDRTCRKLSSRGTEGKSGLDAGSNFGTNGFPGCDQGPDAIRSDLPDPKCLRTGA